MVLPYLVGIVTAPLIGMIAKPLLRGTVKTGIGVALQVKKLAAEATEGLQDIAAEMSTDIAVQDATKAAAAAEVAASTTAKAGQTRGAGVVRRNT